jgi:hypothetical protein
MILFTKSYEFREFYKLISIYNLLVKKALIVKTKEAKALIEIELIEVSHLLSIKFSKWCSNLNFVRELEIYVMSSIKENGHTGLPSSFDFLQNNNIVYNILLKIKDEESNYVSVCSFDLYDEFFKDIINYSKNRFPTNLEVLISSTTELKYYCPPETVIISFYNRISLGLNLYENGK